MTHELYSRMLSHINKAKMDKNEDPELKSVIKNLDRVSINKNTKPNKFKSINYCYFNLFSSNEYFKVNIYLYLERAHKSKLLLLNKYIFNEYKNIFFYYNLDLSQLHHNCIVNKYLYKLHINNINGFGGYEHMPNNELMKFLKISTMNKYLDKSLLDKFPNILYLKLDHLTINNIGFLSMPLLKYLFFENVTFLSTQFFRSHKVLKTTTNHSTTQCFNLHTLELSNCRFEFSTVEPDIPNKVLANKFYVKNTILDIDLFKMFVDLTKVNHFYYNNTIYTNKYELDLKEMVHLDSFYFKAYQASLILPKSQKIYISTICQSDIYVNSYKGHKIYSANANGQGNYLLGQPDEKENKVYLFAYNRFVSLHSNQIDNALCKLLVLCDNTKELEEVKRNSLGRSNIDICLESKLTHSLIEAKMKNADQIHMEKNIDPIEYNWLIDNNSY